MLLKNRMNILSTEGGLKVDIVTKDDLANIFNTFIRKSVTTGLQRPTTEYESSAFRQPELYGIPIFVIGYGGKTATYVGQYIAHKIIKIRQDGKLKTRWRILTGFVRILAKHVDEDIFLEIITNGVPAIGAMEYINNRDQYILIEDRKDISEIECAEEDIINLSGVMNYEDPVLLIDVTGLLREQPADILGRYNELIAVYKALQNRVYEDEQIIDDLRVELETTKAENRFLRNQVYRLNTRILAVSGALSHYKSELLKMKELMHFYLERLEAVKEGKERLSAVLHDYKEFIDYYAETASEIVEKFSRLEEIGKETEETIAKVKSAKKTGESDNE